MVYQITAAMALVVIMGFLVSGIQSGASRDAGFRQQGLSVLSLDPVRDGYSLDEAAGVLAGLPERLTEGDDVEAAALIDLATLPAVRASRYDGVNPRWPRTRGGNDSACRGSNRRPGILCDARRPLERGAEFSNRDFQSTAASAAIPAVSITRPRSSSASILWENSSGSTRGSCKSQAW